MTSPGFKDYFSASAAEYAAFRPRYPEALFEFVASLPARRRTAWDCATGNGQAAIPLAKRFDRVIATDASAEQIAHAERGARVGYRVALADASGIEAGSVDLVTVARSEEHTAESSHLVIPYAVFGVKEKTKARERR